MVAPPVWGYLVAPPEGLVSDYKTRRLLGGSNHFAADRETAQKVLATAPSTLITARENRAFLGRAVRYLVAEAGIRQFLDIGTGLPTANNVHEVAQAVAPESRVVYADNDPLVLAYARALLSSSPEGRTAYIQADLRDPEAILASPGVREVLDFSQPVALILVAVLHFINDEYKPAEAIAALLGALPSGSYLVASHVTGEFLPAAAAETTRTYRTSGVPLRVRDASEFTAVALSGLELVPPGVVLVSEWRPEGDGPRPAPDEVNCYGAVARKPLKPGHCGPGRPAPARSARAVGRSMLPFGILRVIGIAQAVPTAYLVTHGPIMHSFPSTSSVD